MADPFATGVASSDARDTCTRKMRKPVILILTPRYLPGFRAGGPIRTIANLVQYLGDEFEFRIVSADRDYLDQQPYANVAVDAWNAVGKSQVFYGSTKCRSWRGLRHLLQATKYDVLYLNSFFSLTLTVRPLLLRALGLVPRKPVVIAPRGEFSPGALAIKRWRKRVFIWLVQRIGLYSGVRWQASTTLEVAEIHAGFNVPNDSIREACNLVVGGDTADTPPQPERPEANSVTPRPLRVCFLSRISPKKNLDFALRVLSHVHVPVEFTIHGPIDDRNYWNACQHLLAEMPHNVSAHYADAVQPAQVRATIAQHDVFFVPTRGENFGHVFVEAWSAGVPVLVSDCTPWRELSTKGVGWDLPLADPAAYARVLELVAQRTPAQIMGAREACLAFARAQMDMPDAVEANRRLFLDVIPNKLPTRVSLKRA